ncbi:MAG: sulfotransferase, partial [Planctomycetota bacterium]
CFVFICQAGPLELQAMLLAASLKRFLKCRHELVAALPVPEGRWGSVRQKTLCQLAHLGVRTHAVRNEVDPGYPIGNKVACLAIPTDCDKIVFIDSDMLCLREFHHDERFRTEFNAKPVDRLYFGKHESDWEPVYRAVGLPMPKIRLRCTFSGESTLPYFNAGFVAVRDGFEFSNAWRECCLLIDQEPAVHPKRPWLDQLGLATVVSKLELDIGLLGETYNYPANFRRVEDERPPIFCHYHAPKNLVHSLLARSTLMEIFQQHPHILRAMRGERVWSPVTNLVAPPLRQRIPVVSPALRSCRNIAEKLDERLYQRRTPDDLKARNVIVTGLPRSGTSLFSALLNQIENVVCLNEISPTDRCHRFFGRMRQRIQAGKPIWNRFDRSGRLTTNTIKSGVETRESVVEIVDDRFVLAQKYTLPYLNRLEELCDQGWQIWVVVRDPRFAIQSWRSCPPHFGIAEIFPAGPLLAHISFSSEDRDVRRTEVWNHYSRRIHACRDRLQIVRYEDLVEDPRREMGRFSEAYGLKLPAGFAPALETRNRPGAYADDTHGIKQLVEQSCDLQLFGYH